MSALVLAAALVVGIVVLTPVAQAVNVPQPILLLLYGLALALVPVLPDLTLDASLVLPVVLPPLLFAATQRATVVQFRSEAGPVLLLAVGLTVATAAVVAVVAHLAGLPWDGAAVLGAIVAPPDPVAATAVARRLKLPERLVTVLEGEGMFNDATALVLYKVSVTVAVTQEFRVGEAALELGLALVVGVGLGLLGGWLTRVALGALEDASAETTVTVAAPFAAYLAAEHVRGSGVLAVLALGLYLRTTGHGAISARGWVVGRSVWEYADFLITSLVFVLVGFELTRVLEHSSTDAGTLRLAVVVLTAVVIFRPLWVFPAAAIARVVANRRSSGVPYGWRETAVVSWAGMRGVVTVATALALPGTVASGDELAWREQVVLVGLGCVLVTLLAQGLTLTPLVRLLRVGEESDEQEEVSRLRRRALEAALTALRYDGADDDPASLAVIMQYEARLRSHDLVQRVLQARVPTGAGSGARVAAGMQDRGSEADEDDAGDEQRREELQGRLREAFRRGSDVEREVVLAARNAGEVSPGAADEVLDDIEARAARTT